MSIERTDVGVHIGSRGAPGTAGSLPISLHLLPLTQIPVRRPMSPPETDTARREKVEGTVSRTNTHSHCIHQHTSAYVRTRHAGETATRTRAAAASSAYVSIRPHTSAYVSIRPRTSAYVIIRQHTSAYVTIHQHTSAYVRIRPHTSAYPLAAGDTATQPAGCCDKDERLKTTYPLRSSPETTYLL
jgi:hypothetical protein